LRDQCTMECEFCDCTRNIRLPGKSLANEWHINRRKKERSDEDNDFVDLGRLRLNRKKQKEGIEGLRNILDSCNRSDKIGKKPRPIFAGAAILGLFAILYDNDSQDYFRIKNIPDVAESRKLLSTLALKVRDTVGSMKSTARNSLAKSDKRSNVI
jgi:hypothetical protein